MCLSPCYNHKVCKRLGKGGVVLALESESFNDMSELSEMLAQSVPCVEKAALTRLAVLERTSTLSQHHPKTFQAHL